MSEIRKTPAIRFKGFTYAWKKCKLGNLGKSQSGIGFPDSEQGGQIGIPFYKVSDMNKDGNEHEMLSANHYVTSHQIAKRGWKTIDALPAIMFAKVGAAVMLNRKRLVTKTFLLDNNTMAYSFSDQLNTRFGKSLFETIYLPNLVQVGALPSYNATDINEIEVKIPNLDEQEKIGILFENIDSLITLHQRKYEKLQHVKKALLEKMFPKECEVAPKIRFKGFTDAWEQYKLSQLYEFSKGKGLSLDSFYEGNDSLGIAYGHLYTKYTEVINEVNLSTNHENGVLSRIGDLLFPGSSTVPFGTAQSNALMLVNVKLGGDVIIARSKDLSVYAPFISYQINAHKSKLFPITVGTTITHMYGKDIANIEYKFPKLDEQQKIGRTLESLDSLITLHQRKHEKLQNIKKAILQKMFI